MIHEGKGTALGNKSSKVPKAFVEPTTQKGLQDFGLTGLKFQYAGSGRPEYKKKNIINDIDLTVDVESIADMWNLPEPYFSKEFWDAVAKKAKEIGGAWNPGFKNFHLPFDLVDANGQQQPFYEEVSPGKIEPIEGQKGITQVDFFIGAPAWMKDMYSPESEDSSFNAAMRNMFLGTIVSSIDRIETPEREEKYVIDYKQHIERVVTIIKKPKKDSITTRTPFITDVNKFAQWLFGPGINFSMINSFEKAYEAFETNPYFNKKYGSLKEKIKEKFVESLDDSQKEKLRMNGYESLLKEKTKINEGREGIARFAGTSEFKPIELLEFLKALAEEANAIGKEEFSIDLLKSKSIDMVEKMDAAFSHFGINKDSEFFMESNYSGEVTINSVNNPAFKDKKEVFLYLNENKKFQDALRKVATINGELTPIRFDAEMFPVMLKSKGSDDIVFASTRYKRSKLGKFGAFVIFKCWVWDQKEENWRRPAPEISERYISGLKKLSSSFNEEWKIYSNQEDMRLPGIINVEIGPVADLLKSENYENTIKVLSSRKKEDAEKKASIENLLTPLRQQLQKSLDEYANGATSKLGDENSAVEGVVLRIKPPTGEVLEVKGTSKKFAEQAQIIWGERKEIDLARKAFKSAIKTQVLGMPNEADKVTIAKIKNALGSNDVNAKTKLDYFNLMIKASVPNYAEALTNVGENLKLALKKLTDSINSPRVNKEGKKLPSLVKSFEDKKKILDVDSIKTTESYFESIDQLLKQYGELSKKRNSTDKYRLVFQKYFEEEYDSLMPKTKVSEEPMTRVILWYGRAQPWHKGHSAMIELGKKNLSKFKAEKIVLMVAKGEESSEDLENNPLKEEEQIELINSIYGNDPQIIVVGDVFPTNGYGVMDIASTKNYLITAWLAGEDRASEYQRLINNFDKERFLFDHNNVVFDLDENGKAITQIILTPRVFSGTKAKTMSIDPNVDFETWFKEVTQSGLGNNVKKVYEKIYNIMKERIPKNKQQPVQEIVLSVFNEHIVKRKGKFCLLSKKSGRNLGCYRSKSGAKKREKQIQYFKHLKQETSAASSGAIVVAATTGEQENDR